MHGDRGFTLLEVLVAFVIAMGALALLSRVGLDGLRGATLSGRYQEAVARAQSHLAGVGANPPLGDRQGDEGDGFHWRVRVMRRASTALPQGKAASLLAISVGISWGVPQRTVELDTERVVPGAAEAP